VLILAALSAAALSFVTNANRELLQPVLATPEGAAVYAGVVRRTLLVIAAFDVPLLALVGIASYALALLSLRPLAALREREERFVADAAHELRTPLAEIATTAQAASPADDASRAAFASIARASLGASALVGDLLTLARRPELEARALEPVALGPLARDVVAGFAATARLPIAVMCVDGALVAGDERRLRRLLVNLLENAVRHARERVEVTVAVRDGFAEIDVADDGPGVAAGDRERVFDRFFSSRPSGEGSGLGLAICRWIARAHDGDISVEGARFRTRLPLVS